MKRTKIAQVLSLGQPDESHQICGWVRTRRDSKQGFSFIELNDGSSMQGLQVVVDADVPGFEEVHKLITTGASLRLVGKLQESPGKGQRVEMLATEIELLGTA
ncbi:MAG: asparagine--tRNA ligase, partial [Planctomycetaceae bacterium]|nr:asparagine--tRNA ligase [Planctomycetaceae bacterium]